MYLAKYINIKKVSSYNYNNSNISKIKGWHFYLSV